MIFVVIFVALVVMAHKFFASFKEKDKIERYKKYQTELKYVSEIKAQEQIHHKNTVIIMLIVSLILVIIYFLSKS